LNPFIIKILVYGLLLGCIYSFNSWIVTGKSQWQLNVFIGLVVMGLGAASDKLVPGIGMFVTSGLGVLAGYTIIKRQQNG
jgi:hypothetical protein